MKRLTYSIIIGLWIATHSLQAQAQEIVVYSTSPEEIQLQRELEADKIAKQWVAAFSALKTSGSSNKIELLTGTNGVEFTQQNVYSLTVSPSYRGKDGKIQNGNLLVAEYKIGSRTFKTIIAPSQIIAIREVQP